MSEKIEIIVVSDNHGDRRSLAKVLADNQITDYVFHCGDSMFDNDDELMRNLIKVRGNSDFRADYYPNTVTQELTNGMTVFMAHGHRHDRYSAENTYLLEAAMKAGASFAFYGHTHFADVSQENGVIIVNPGSTFEPRFYPGRPLGVPTYAKLVITEATCNVQILTVADNTVVQEKDFAL